MAGTLGFLVRGKGCKKCMMLRSKSVWIWGPGIAVNSFGHGDPDWHKAVVEQASTLIHVGNVYHAILEVRISSF